ncbi:MAG: InlB B-repeat-containing protein, partial [Lachnospiraceae bacterium]
MKSTRLKKRVVSFVLAVVMLFSSVNTDLHSLQASEPNNLYGGAQTEVPTGNATEAETTEGVTEAETTEGVTEAETTEGVTEAETTEGVTEAETTEGVTEAETTEGVTEPETTEGVTEAETTEGATEPETTQGTQSYSLKALSAATEEKYVLHANSINLTAAKNGAAVDFENCAKFSYGTVLSFTAKSGDKQATELSVYYGTKEGTIVSQEGNIDHNSLKQYLTDTVLPVGDYYIFFNSQEAGSLGEGGVIDYALRVESKKLANPSNLRWGTGESAMTALWNPVTTDIDGNALIGDGTVSYQLALYYGDETEPIYTSGNLTETSLDLKGEITKAQASGGKGYGDYTFKVEAIPANTNYASASSALESAYTYKDTVKPVITSYEVIEEDGVKKLQANAYDTGIGIKYYAFASSAVSESSIAWKQLDSAVAGNEGYTATEKVSDIGPGTIYFYAKDEHGNVTCQQVAKTDGTDKDPIVISKVTLKNYYSANVASEPSVYLIGDEGYTLPVAADMARTGYVFDGWYLTENGEGTKYTELTPGDGADILPKGSELTLYGHWNTQTVSFAKQPQSETKTYNGVSKTLEAELAAALTYDSVEWQWYYKKTEGAVAQAVEGGTGNGRGTTLALYNVKDSGYYYAVATIKTTGLSDVTATSNTAQVTINQRPLNIQIKSEQVNYMDEVPASFSFELGSNQTGEGLVGGDTLDALFAAEKAHIETTYQKGDPVTADGYPITYNGEIAKDNYDVHLTDGKLKVVSMDLTNSDKVTVTLSENSYIYDNSAKQPEVTGVSLSLGETPVALYEGADKDYTYTWRENVDADKTGEGGTAVVITFGGNYKGTYEVPFTIEKADYAVKTQMSGWKYGETANAPSVDVLKNCTQEQVTYYYLEVAKRTGEDDTETYLSLEDAKTAYETVDKSTKTTVKPVNAGRYYVWAVIPATDNYKEITAEPAIFDILPREIVITASSFSWEFDENEHSDSTCTITGDGFVGQDDFQWYTANGSIREIGEVDNVVSYKLTSATLSRNYHITTVKGTLTVTATKLVPPSTFNWSSVPGTVSWIAITKDNLTVQYELKLYRTQLNDDGTVKMDSNGNVMFHFHRVISGTVYPTASD